jgi:hypothetical protein
MAALHLTRRDPDLFYCPRWPLGVAATMASKTGRLVLAAIILILMVTGAMCWAVEAIIGVGVL